MLPYIIIKEKIIFKNASLSMRLFISGNESAVAILRQIRSTSAFFKSRTLMSALAYKKEQK